MQPLLKLTNIKRSYGAIQALKGASFEIMPGEVIGLVGENGAGKSTMVKIISGFDSGFTGEYELNGEALHFSSPDSGRASGDCRGSARTQPHQNDECGREYFSCR